VKTGSAPIPSDNRIIRAVLFDLDDTLFDHDYCARTALESVRSSHACFASVAPEALERTHAGILEELHLEVMAGRLDLDVARRERFRRLFESAGLDAGQTLASETASTYRQRYLAARRAVAGAAALLKAVRERARVGVVSNNLLEEQQDKLQHCQLDQYVDVLVVSEEAGVSKPDPRIFQMTLERLGCQPREAVMIGDSWEADITGASAAGIRAIWFKRGMKDEGRGMGDVAVISTLEPTPQLLTTIFGQQGQRPGLRNDAR
jgi:putative hydrolase of the HAD superfamily